MSEILNAINQVPITASTISSIIISATGFGLMGIPMDAGVSSSVTETFYFLTSILEKRNKIFPCEKHFFQSKNSFRKIRSSPRLKFTK